MSHIQQSILTQTIPNMNPLMNGHIIGNGGFSPQVGGYNPSSPNSTSSSLTPNSNVGVDDGSTTSSIKSRDETGSEPSSPNDSEESSVPKKAGRRKIKIEFIEDKNRRHITFSKRKSGIMKKAYELSTLTGTQVLLLVASETGHVYTFATPKLQPLITRPDGKNLIQSCLNTPDGVSSPNQSLSRLTYNTNSNNINNNNNINLNNQNNINNNMNTINNSNSTSSNSLLGSNSPNCLVSVGNNINMNSSNNNIGISNNQSPNLDSTNPLIYSHDYMEALINSHSQNSTTETQKDIMERSRSNLIQSPIKTENPNKSLPIHAPTQYLQTTSPNFNSMDPYSQMAYAYQNIRYNMPSSASTTPFSPLYNNNYHVINQYPSC